MPYRLKPGDRVRITERIRLDNYQPGDTGTVMSGPHTYPSGAVYYRVTMDVQPLAEGILFLADEIEPDVRARRLGRVVGPPSTR